MIFGAAGYSSTVVPDLHGDRPVAMGVLLAAALAIPGFQRSVT